MVALKSAEQEWCSHPETDLVSAGRTFQGNVNWSLVPGHLYRAPSRRRSPTPLEVQALGVRQPLSDPSGGGIACFLTFVLLGGPGRARLCAGLWKGPCYHESAGLLEPSVCTLGECALRAGAEEVETHKSAQHAAARHKG